MAKESLTSIVVLTYNGLNDVTRPCLDSILAHTPKGDYELLIVDNASSDGTQEYLRQLAHRHDHIRLQLNNINKGYAGGNNDGLRMATGEFIVLLNNDTLVSSKWLERLLRLLKENRNIGLVGPVTNSAGNDQRIELPRLNAANFAEISGEYVARQKGVWYPTERLGFFCVAVRDDVVQRIGYLDERFGLGMFEDDDYCLRAKKAGYTLAVAEDCFVFHKGSVSFGKLSVASYRNLFEKNRALFNSLHQVPWSFTDISLSYWEKFNRDLSALMLESKPVPPALERILMRWENFRHLLVQVHRAEMHATHQDAIKSSPILVRAKWRTRWFNFRRNVLTGTWRDRYRYLQYIVQRIHYRIVVDRQQPASHPDLATLLAELPQSANRKVMIFPATVDYSYMRQRPQNLADAFADAGYFVIYGTLNHVSDNVKVAQRVRDNLYLVNEALFAHLVDVVRAEQSTYYCLWPNNAKHLLYLPYSKLLYDYMDDLALLDLLKSDVKGDHQFMLQKADLITVSASQLLDALPEMARKKAILLPNAVSDWFSNAVLQPTQSPPELTSMVGRKIIGYYGAIAEWIDFRLLTTLAIKLPGCEIVLIGPVSDTVARDVRALSKHRNIHVLPPRSQADLIPFLQRFDVCVIPFIKNQVTDAISPVKVYEYMAAGKPVLSTSIRECLAVPLIECADSEDAFVDRVRELLRSAPAPDRLQLMARSNTWRHRARQIESILDLEDFRPDLYSDALKEIQTEISESLIKSRPDFAAHYMNVYSKQEFRYWAPVLRWIDELSAVESVIDIGAAYGTLLLYACGKHHPRNSVVGDKVPFFPVDLASGKDIKLIPCDIERDGIFSDAKYDLIIFTEVIEHLNFHPLPTLLKLKSMMAAGGRLLLTTPDADSWGKTEKYYSSLSDIPLYCGQQDTWVDDHVWQYTKSELDSLLASAGLVIKEFAYAPGAIGSGRHLCYLLSQYHSDDCQQPRSGIAVLKSGMRFQNDPTAAP